jgi:hypothetical protein
MFYFTPLPGFFSPFPHGTSSLSVIQEYLALRGGPRRFTRGFTCPMLLGIQLDILYFWLQDYHLLQCRIPSTSPNMPNLDCCPATLQINVVWASPFSLAATVGIAIAFFSSGY